MRTRFIDQWPTLLVAALAGTFGVALLHVTGLLAAAIAADDVTGGSATVVASAPVLDYIEDDTTVFERAPLERLAAAGELGAFQHHGFWHGMDTLWDKIYLN